MKSLQMTAGPREAMCSPKRTACCSSKCVTVETRRFSGFSSRKNQSQTSSTSLHDAPGIVLNIPRRMFVPRAHGRTSSSQRSAKSLSTCFRCPGGSSRPANASFIMPSTNMVCCSSACAQAVTIRRPILSSRKNQSQIVSTSLQAIAGIGASVRPLSLP